MILTDCSADFLLFNKGSADKPLPLPQEGKEIFSPLCLPQATLIWHWTKKKDIMTTEKERARSRESETEQ